jgi:predicted metallo-beta-lactamase superfamily hydrolase
MIESGSRRFVFASDQQCVNPSTIDRILAWNPTHLFTSGPPIHLPDFGPAERQNGLDLIRRLTDRIPTVVLDHHTLRAPDWEEYLGPAREAAVDAGHQLVTASEFMNRPIMALEANRQALFDLYPVEEEWFDRFFKRDKETYAEIDRLRAEIEHVDRFDLESLAHYV